MWVIHMRTFRRCVPTTAVFEPDQQGHLQAVHGWFKNHSTNTTKQEGGAPKPCTFTNPLWKFISAHGVSPMRLWASQNLDILRESGWSDIGAFSKASAKWYHQLSHKEKQKWEQRTAEHNKDKDDQHYLYVVSLLSCQMVSDAEKKPTGVHGGHWRLSCPSYRL